MPDTLQIAPQMSLSFRFCCMRSVFYFVFHRVLKLILCLQLCSEQVQKARRILANALDTLATFSQLCDLGCDRRTLRFIIG